MALNSVYDQRLCFHIYANSMFSHDTAHMRLSLTFVVPVVVGFNLKFSQADIADKM